MKIATYETDLIDTQWQLLEPLLPAAKKRGRPRTSLRAVCDAIFYSAKAGCPWRLLPQAFPPWKTVYPHFHQWSRNGLLGQLNTQLRTLARKAEDKRARPTAAGLDSQTVRSNPHGGAVGYDAGKKTRGRKRFLLVDTLGLVLGAAVQPANTPERAGARSLLQPVLPHLTWLRKLWVDGGYTGADFAAWVKTQRPKLEVEVIKRSDDVSGFKGLPKRWVVERTFGWLMQHRRLVRDYDGLACLMSDYIFPGSGPQVQQRLGFTKTVPAIDIRAQCSGFLYAMSVADAWIRSGFYKRVLVIGSEVQSTTLDITPRGRDNAILFGDAAAACIVEATTDEEQCILDTVLHSEGQWATKLGLFKPSANDFPRLGEGQTMDASVYGTMEGRLVFKHAVQRMTESLFEICRRNKIKPSAIDFVIAHQANQRIIEMVLTQLEIPAAKIHYTLDRFGNTTAATIPLTMGEAEELGKIKRGDLVAWTAFGSGFAWGATLLRY